MNKKTAPSQVVAEKIEQGKDFVDSMVILADYLEQNNSEHEPKGKYYEKAKKVLRNYRDMKFYTLEYMTNISADQCRREIKNRDLEVFDYYYRYEDLPYSGSHELPTVATVFDVYDFCGETLSKKKMEEYFESRKLQYETILSVLCEKILDAIKQRSELAYDVLYMEYFDISRKGIPPKDKWNELGISRACYYKYRDDGIVMFSNYLFSPLGQMYLSEQDENKHGKMLEHLKEAAKLATEIMSEKKKK